MEATRTVDKAHMSRSRIIFSGYLVLTIDNHRSLLNLDDYNIDRTRRLATRTGHNACCYHPRVDIVDWHHVPTLSALVSVLPSSFGIWLVHFLFHARTTIQIRSHSCDYGGNGEP